MLRAVAGSGDAAAAARDYPLTWGAAAPGAPPAPPPPLPAAAAALDALAVALSTALLHAERVHAPHLRAVASALRAGAPGGLPAPPPPGAAPEL